MKLTSVEAKGIVESYRGKTLNDKWIDHSLCVGDTAGKIAKALEEKGYNIDVDKTIAIGYVHDIGKYNGESHGHVMRGYNYLKDKGYDEDYCNICLTHSYLNNDISIVEGQEKSYQEILKICNWLNFDTKNKVFKGSNGYIENGYNETNEAVEKIIEIANKNEKTYIMANG